MKIKEFFPWMVGIAALLLSGGPATAGEPLLVTADLASEIQSLPDRRSADPIQPLQRRLTELGRKNPASNERRALQEAVSLIWIVRQTRITSALPRNAKGVLITDNRY